MIQNKKNKINLALLLILFGLLNSNIFKSVDTFLSGTDFDIIANTDLLEELLGKILNISLGKSDSGADHDLFVTID